MRNPPAAELYLTAVIGELIKLAREAKVLHAEKKASAGEVGAQVETGRGLAYYEVISLLLDQLDSFGIPRDTVGVDPQFDVDELL